jgi:hypothetical protein
VELERPALAVILKQAVQLRPLLLILMHLRSFLLDELEGAAGVDVGQPLEMASLAMLPLLALMDNQLTDFSKRKKKKNLTHINNNLSRGC